MFDEETGTLAVTFHSTRRYLFDGVPRTVFDAFGRAASAGRFFNESVRGRFPCRPDPARRRHRPSA